MAWLTPPAPAFNTHYFANANLGQTNLLLTQRTLPAPAFATHFFPNSVRQGHWPHNTLTVPIGGGGAGAAPAGYAT